MEEQALGFRPSARALQHLGQDLNRADQAGEVADLAGYVRDGSGADTAGAGAPDQFAADLNRAAIPRLGLLIAVGEPEAAAHAEDSDRIGQVAAELRVAGRRVQQILEQGDGPAVILRGLGQQLGLETTIRGRLGHAQHRPGIAQARARPADDDPRLPVGRGQLARLLKDLQPLIEVPERFLPIGRAGLALGQPEGLVDGHLGELVDQGITLDHVGVIGVAGLLRLFRGLLRLAGLDLGLAPGPR